MARKRKVGDPSDDLPVRQPQPAPHKVEDKPTFTLDESLALPFPDVDEFLSARSKSVPERAAHCLEQIKTLIKETLYENPGCAGFSFDLNEDPEDVRMIVAASLKKAGFKIALLGNEIHVNLPHVDLVMQPTPQVSKVNPL